MASVRRIADKVAMVHNGVIIWCGPAGEMDDTGIEEVHQFVHGLADGPLTLAAQAKRGAADGEDLGKLRLSAMRGGRTANGRVVATIAERGTRSSRSASRHRPGRGKATGRRVDMQPLATSGDVTPPPRMKTGMAEFDRVAGGGLVAGSATLIGGDPGIGKSTLLLQLVCRLAADGRRTAYVSGEESAEQVRMRARRLGLGSAEVDLATSTNAADIAASIGGKDGPEVVVIDSDPDDVPADAGFGTGHRQPGPGHRAGIDQAAKTNDVGASGCRACHQGRRHRRPTRSGTYGRHGPVFRR